MRRFIMLSMCILRRFRQAAPGRGLGIAALLGAVLWLGLAGHGLAASSPWTSQLSSEEAPARLRLLAAPAGDRDELLLGLEFELLPGWKIYWRTPGDAGFPPEIDWAGSENLDRPSILWPAPERFRVLGLDTFGYRDRVVLPIRAGLKDATQPLRVRAHVSYLVCDVVCIPGEAKLALDAAAGTAASSESEVIARYLARVPGAGAFAGLVLERAEFAETLGRLSVMARAESPFHKPDLYVEGPEGYAFGAPEVRFWEGKRRALFYLPVTRSASAPPASALLGAGLRFTLVDDLAKSRPRAVERVLPVVPASADALSGRTLAVVLALAFVGGLILNLMPCVLPVLSLKLLAVVGHGGAPRAEVRKGFLASAAGILVAFLTLAGAIAFLRGAGVAVGWGFQFQSPFFLLAMTAVLVLFAANLWGFFEIRLPSSLQSGLAERGGGHGLTGHFLTGVFATLLATPCSAPFLGTSIGFALSRGLQEIFAIFLALGVGFAFPYLLVALFPGVASHLPRPGPWMGHLRRLLGVALIGTAVWLLGVLAAGVGAPSAFAIGGLLALLLLVLVLGGRFPERKAAFRVLAAVLLLSPLLITVAAPPPGPGAAGKTDAGPWRAFDAAAIPALVEEGRVVFVDVTAEWCLTCQANKAIVLDRGAVAEKLNSGAVIAMRADWTRPDAEIAAYLAQFGRFGIPFNVVYGPGAPTGIPLPELLSGEAVLEAMARAARTAAPPLAKSPYGN